MGGAGALRGEIGELPGIATNRFAGHGYDAGLRFEVVQSQDAGGVGGGRISAAVWGEACRAGRKLGRSLSPEPQQDEAVLAAETEGMLTLELLAALQTYCVISSKDV